MSLPIDIPWKRLAVSEDMIDTTPSGQISFPKPWRSSMSIFYYEPTDLPPEYCNRTITYLKVVCTLANYQNDTVTALDYLSPGFDSSLSYEKLIEPMTKSYPCYGALFQISIHPNPSQGVPLHNYPYIQSFQPRKREMYEITNESGEVLSQSSSKISLTKGTTTADTTEEYGLAMGGRGGGVGIGFGSFNGNIQTSQKQEGGIVRNTTEKQDIRNTDASREKRESYSYSTNVNNLYSLLQGYHLGSNYSAFLMQPRPHMQDIKSTFVRGPRRLEGIQEFFFVINRPKSIPAICVEATLETAHFEQHKTYMPRIIPFSELYQGDNLEKTNAALGNDETLFPLYLAMRDVWNNIHPWFRARAIDRAKGGDWDAWIYEKTSNDPELARKWTVLFEVIARLPDTGTENIALIFEEVTKSSGHFFVFARQIKACTTAIANGAPDTLVGANTGGTGTETSDKSNVASVSESIVFEEDYKGPVSTSGHSKPDSKKIDLEMNEIISDLNEKAWSSLGSSKRYPYGKVSIEETGFALENLRQLTKVLRKKDVKDKKIDEIKGLDSTTLKQLKSINVNSILDLENLKTDTIIQKLKVSKIEAKKIHSKIFKSTLSQLDLSTTKDSKSVNVIQESFDEKYPKDRLAELEKSAGAYSGKFVFFDENTKINSGNSKKKSTTKKHNKEN